MMKKTKGSQINDLETGKKVNPVLIKDVLGKSQGWLKLALFLVSVPTSIVVLLVYALSFLLPWFCAVPLGVTIGLTLCVVYMDKLMVMLK